MPVVMRRVLSITQLVLVSIICVICIFNAGREHFNSELPLQTLTIINAETDRSRPISLEHTFSLTSVANSSLLFMKGNLTSPDDSISVVEPRTKYPERPGKYTLQITYSLNGRNQVITLIKFIVPGYIVTIEGGIYLARGVDEALVIQGKDFVDMMNSLFTQLIPGDVILIRSGEYTLTKSIRNTNRNGVTLRGEPGTVFKASSANIDGMLWIYGGGGLNPSGCVVEGITFDANYNAVMSPTVGIGGSFNVVQNCVFLNTMQYGLHAWRAHNFQFINNRVEKAQYGISTGAHNSEWCSNGLISNNFITYSQDCAIKLRWIRDTLISNNTIEIVNTNCKGIRLYHADGPTVNITITQNDIRSDEKVELTGGIWVDYDSRALSSGSYITGNRVYGCYYGIYNDWGSVSIEENVIINTHFPIHNSNDSAIVSDNIIS